MNDEHATAVKRSLALKAINQQRRIRQLEALLRKVRAALALDTAIWEAELINEIDEVVKP